MDLGAYANMNIPEVMDYINKHYGDIPRPRGVRFMCVESPIDNAESSQCFMYNKYIGQHVIYIHTRCGNCGNGYEGKYSNYVSCGGKDWEEKHKDLFLDHCTDEFDSTYCDHYFKAVVDDEYNKLIDELKRVLSNHEDDEAT